MNKIKPNDEVIIIAGKDKGSVGTVTKVMGLKLIVEGFNLVKKHVRPNPQAGIEGGIEEKTDTFNALMGNAPKSLAQFVTENSFIFKA